MEYNLQKKIPKPCHYVVQLKLNNIVNHLYINKTKTNKKLANQQKFTEWLL